MSISNLGTHDNAAQAIPAATSRTASACAVSSFSWTVAVVSSLLGPIVRAFRIWHAERQLMQMPGHMLKDIGISRSDIHSVVRHGRSAQAVQDDEMRI